MNALTVRGPFLTQSGYGHHTRQFVSELHRQGIAIQLIDLPAWSPVSIPGARRNPWYESLNAPVSSEIMLHFCMPHQLLPDPRKLNVNFTMFEASRVPPEWIHRSRTHDLLIVPTASSRRAWEDSGMPPGRIRTCPLGVDTTVFAPSWEPPGADQPRTRFLNVSEHGSRKNLGGLLRAWISATRPDDDAILTIKSGRSLKSAYLPAGLERAAPVRVLRQPLSDNQMPGLYREATHYISASFGEGWDLPMTEAAASGLKLIAPDHSAYRHYLDPTIATMIPARAVPAVYDSNPEIAELFKGAHWWEPDQPALVESIRAAIEGREPPTASARDRMARDFSWAAAARRLIEILTELKPLAAGKRLALEHALRRSSSPGATHSRPAGAPDPDPS
jgi:glycosyltransferase involved in cell wall biosynthesis